MAVQNRGRDTATASGSIQQVGVDGNANVSAYGPDINANGRYRIFFKSGALTAIAAVTSTAGHLATFRNPHATKLALIERVRLNFQTTVMPSVAQEVGLSLIRTTSHSANATGGADVTLTTPQAKLRVSHAVPNCTCHFANSTGALTAGTYTQDSVALAEESVWELAAGAAVQFPVLTLDRDFSGSPIVLAQNEGLLVANTILMANSVAGKLRAEITFREVDSYPQ